MIPLFVMPFALLLVLAFSTSGGEYFTDHHPFRIGDEQELLVTASPLTAMNWVPSWGEKILGEQPRVTAETPQSLV
jgi:hypothetical protein